MTCIICEKEVRDNEPNNKCHVECIEKMQREIEFLRQRENKLQLIEQMYKSGVVDLEELYELVNEDVQDS